MHRLSGGLVALSIAACSSCSSFGTGMGTQSTNDAGVGDGSPSNGSDAAASNGDGGEAGASCDIGPCTAGCTKYNFAGSVCPPPDWAFGGDAPVKECANNRIHLLGENSLDATAQLVMRTPGSLRGARIDLRLAIKRWAVLNGGRARVILAGAQLGTGVGITAIENPARNYDLQLCRLDSNGARQDCINLDVITPNVEHVVSFDWSETTVTATIDCKATASQPSARINGNTDFGLSFGLNDASPIDGTIGDVTVSFR